MIQVFQIPALKDNYIHILRSSSGSTAVVDPSLEKPVSRFLKKKGWTLDFIFNTHHHYDHTDGNLPLKKIWSCQVAGFEQDAHRIPGIDIFVKENQIFKWNQHECSILFIPGHTKGHIAFWFQKENILFCGDTLFAMGCGKLFEGTPQQMLSSLNILAQLPSRTLVYCGHEYTQKNGSFALTLEPNNSRLQKRMIQICKKRKQGLSTVPFSLLEELHTNPFLRCRKWIQDPSKIGLPSLKKWLKENPSAAELSLFTKIRKMKDRF